MARRHNDAMTIQCGACNPVGIAQAIVEACREIRSEPSFNGTNFITTDPAIRLMVHQLAFICGVINGAEEFTDKPNYSKAMEACREKAHASLSDLP